MVLPRRPHQSHNETYHGTCTGAKAGYEGMMDQNWRGCAAGTAGPAPVDAETYYAIPKANTTADDGRRAAQGELPGTPAGELMHNVHARCVIYDDLGMKRSIGHGINASACWRQGRPNEFEIAEGQASPATEEPGQTAVLGFAVCSLSARNGTVNLHHNLAK